MLFDSTEPALYSPLQVPISECLGGDEKQVMIHISDRAGGIPFDATQRVWSYLYTTAKDTRCSDPFAIELFAGRAHLSSGLWNWASRVSPLGRKLAIGQHSQSWSSEASVARSLCQLLGWIFELSLITGLRDACLCLLSSPG